MVSVDRRLFVVLAAVFMLAVSVQVILSDDSDAADSSYVRSVSMRVYDQDSEEYANLAYLSSELPSEFSPAEWVRDADNGLWYNINTASSDFGSILRYGMVHDITLSEIRSDIGDSRGEFTSSSFVIAQVGFDINGDCGVNVEIKKAGATVFSKDETASLSVAGSYIATTVQGVFLYSVGSGCDIDVADPAGLYSVAVKCNGIAAGNATTDYRGTVYNLYGSVEDKGAKPIPGAVVTYQITDSEGTLMSEGSILTDASGNYIIQSVGGTIVNITSVAADGFTFSTSTYSYGTVTGDAFPGMIFTANENYIRVIVKDQSARPAAGVEISAVWFRSFPNGDGTYTIEAKTSGVAVPASTDADGIALVTLSEVFSEYNLLVKGMTGQFSFEDVDPIYATPSSSQPLPDHLEHAGNAYANVTSFVDLGITADDYSVIMTVSGAIDASSQGGAVLQGVQLGADWYYQYPDGSDYKIRDKNSRDYADPATDNLSPGKVWMSTRYTAEDGTILLHYTKPANLMAGEEAFLYVYAIGGAASSPSADYNFTYTLPADGSRTVIEIADSYPAAVAMAPDAVVDAEVVSDDVSYTLHGEITGDLPDSVRVYCITPSGIEMSRVVSPVSGTLTFSFTVKRGDSCKVGIDDLPGYTFTPQTQQMASAYNDMITFTSVSSASSWSVDRETPALLKTYTVSGVAEGDILNFKYSVAGTNVTMQVRATGSTVSVPVMGNAGNVVDSFNVTGDGLYIKWTSDTEVTVAEMTQITVVTYYDTSADQPTIDNVVGGQTVQIYVEGVSYAVVVSDANGKATTSVPGIPEISFRLNDLYVPSAPITDGAYGGCTGLNLKEVIPSPASKIATVTIRHIATSSLQNEGTPTNVDILSGPMTLDLTVGDTREFTAPEVEGFTFSGWFINGTNVSGARDIHVCSIRVTEDMNGATLVASYAADNPETPEEDIGPLVAVGILSLTIAIIGLIFVILQRRRY